MKFDPGQYLKTHQDDPVKALKALHAEVEARETENYEAREALRQAKKELLELKTSPETAPEGKVLIDQSRFDLLTEYEALGSIDDLSAAADELEEAQGALFRLAVTDHLLGSGVGLEQLEDAIKVVMIDPDKFLSEDGDEVTFNSDKLKTEYPMMFTNSNDLDDDASDADDDNDDEDSDGDEDDTELDVVKVVSDVEKGNLSKESKEIRIVGGRRNREKPRDQNLADVAKKMAEQNSFVPNL